MQEAVNELRRISRWKPGDPLELGIRPYEQQQLGDDGSFGCTVDITDTPYVRGAGHTVYIKNAGGRQ